MLKKILLGMGLVGVLATAGFSKEVEINIDNNFCKSYNFYTYEMFTYMKFDSNLSNGVRDTVIKETGDKIYARDVGQMATEFLKENGIGYSVNKSWGNIALSFDKFQRYASSREDRKEISKFIMNLSLTVYKEAIRIVKQKKGNINKDYLNEKNELDKIYAMKYDFLNEVKKENSEGRKVFSKLVQEFIILKGEQKELYSPFAKYVINDDYSRALEYIKQVNKKSGINNLYKQFEVCEK